MAVVAIVEVPFAKYQAEHGFEIKMADPDGAALALKIDGNFRRRRPRHVPWAFTI